MSTGHFWTEEDEGEVIESSVEAKDILYYPSTQLGFPALDKIGDTSIVPSPGILSSSGQEAEDESNPWKECRVCAATYLPSRLELPRLG